MVTHDYSNIWQTVQSEFACEHEHIRLVRFTKSNGIVCVREQCKTCGAHIKEVPKREIGFDINSLPEWDKKLQENWCKAQRERQAELYEAARQEKNAEWWAKYNQYLRSQQWHDIRQRILERDGGICQACLRNKASQVHHLSYALYEQLGRSAAFELVAICYQCHKAIHPHLADAQHLIVENLYNPYLNGGKNGHN